ncbi:hypothetical protein HY230_08110 [Candidatus Acetothermia bacterium]|nr:hypothetical protein [Candidatus Acetothermia bacterium]
MSRALNLVLVFVCFVVTTSSVGADPLDPSGKYTIDAKLDIGNHTLDATETVDYLNDGDTPLSAVYFLLYPNYSKERNPKLDPAVTDQGYWDGFDPGGVEILSVKDANGNALKYALQTGPDSFQTYSLKDTLLRVELAQPLAQGTQTRIKIEFSTKFPHISGADEGWHSDIYTWRFAWNPVAIPARELIQGEFISNKRAYYKFDLPASTYELTLTIPEEYTAAIGGDRVEEPKGASTKDSDKTAKDYKKLHVTTKAPVRSVPFSIGKTLKKFVLKSEVVPIEVYYLPGHEAAARQIATYASEILEYHQAHWGPYSYERLVIVEANASGYFGEAADGFVLFGGSAFAEKDLTVAGTADRLIDYLLAHELGHQWWGIGIGSDFNAENWVSESFAEYVSITYFEQKYGEFGPNLIKLDRQGLLEKAVESQLGYLNLREHFSDLPYLATIKDRFDEAIVKPQQDTKFANNSTQRIYNKGYLMIRAFRAILGEDKLHEVLKEANKRFVHKLITTDDFEKLAEELSGQNLKYYFDEMFRKDDPVAPTLDYGVSGFESEKISESKYKTTVHLFRNGELKIPAEVVAITDSDDETSQIWKAEKAKEDIAFETSKPVKEVRVDPKSWLPDINRLNNNSPTRTKIITTGDNDLPIDAYLLKLNPVTQTVEGGYLLDHRWVAGNGYVAGIINFGRGMLAQAALALSEGQLIGQLGMTMARYQHPDIGIRGTFWEPTDQFQFSVARLLDSSQNPLRGLPVVFGGVDYQRSESTRHVYALGVSLREGFYCCQGDSTNPQYFTALRLSAATLFKIWANVNLQLYVTMGLGWDTPGMFRFGLGELNSFYRSTPDGKLQKLYFPGSFKVLGRAAISFPARRELQYYLLNLAMVDRVDMNLFVTAGQTGDKLDDLKDLKDLKIEAGAAATIEGEAISGLIPVSLTIGLAFPVQGAESDQRRPRLFVGANLPF